MSKCCFCLCSNLIKLYSGKFHKIKKDHGPFDIFLCNNCQSCITNPAPSQNKLQNLYDSFDGGMDNYTRNLRDANPLHSWYKQCIKNGFSYLPKKFNVSSEFTWIDIGAGKGELAKLLSEIYPNSNGIAIDFHAKPILLDNCKNIEWIQCDLNSNTSFNKMGLKKADIIFSITVLEHVIKPDEFIKNIFSLVNRNGVFYLTVPDFSSIAAVFLGKYWPYLLPGEHLNIPSKKGIKLLINRLCEELKMKNDTFHVFVNRIILPYPISYYLEYFGVKNAHKTITKRFTLPFPTGILEAGIILY